jgi:hypothetical protein
MARPSGRPRVLGYGARFLVLDVYVPVLLTWFTRQYPSGC